MKTVNRFHSLLVATLVLLLTGCLATQQSSSSSSSSMPSSQSSQPSPAASSSSSSSSSQSQQQSRQQPGEYGGRDSGFEEAEEQQAGGMESAQESGADSESSMGDEAPYETSPYSEPSDSAAGGGNSGDILSEEEALEALDEQFEESIAVFDGMIINERAAAQAASDAFPEEGDLFEDEEFGDEAFGDDEPLFEEGDIAEDSDRQGASSTDAEEGGASHSQERAERGTGTMASSSDTMSTGRAGARIPADIPDGSDDDIVARQIREAAMKESDPVLREKLWEEYRKYKQGQ